MSSPLFRFLNNGPTQNVLLSKFIPASHNTLRGLVEGITRKPAAAEQVLGRGNISKAAEGMGSGSFSVGSFGVLKVPSSVTNNVAKLVRSPDGSLRLRA